MVGGEYGAADTDFCRGSLQRTAVGRDDHIAPQSNRVTAGKLVQGELAAVI